VPSSYREVKRIYKAYKFRLYPNKKQEILINKTFGCVRFVYNKMLTEREKIYEQYKDNEEELKKQKFPAPTKYRQEFEWLKEVDSLALWNAQINLRNAYNNYFRNKNIGFPKFKSKKKSKYSYTTNNINNNIRIKENKIKLPKLGFVNIKIHRQILDNQLIKSCTISKTPTNKYYISILVEFEQEIKSKEINIDNVLGLDYSQHELYIDSLDRIANYPKYYYIMLDKFRREQRKLSKCQKGSNNRNKQRLKVAKLYEKVANQRKDFLHKISKILTDIFDAIIIEDLDMKKMSKNLKLGKGIYDNAWGIFTTYLKYKLENKGKQLIKIDKWFPSSKKCNECGEINQELQLSDRKWVCISCGSIINRDYNAAKNIRDEGIRLLAV
jgi:putative transposase